MEINLYLVRFDGKHGGFLLCSNKKHNDKNNINICLLHVTFNTTVF